MCDPISEILELLQLGNHGFVEREVRMAGFGNAPERKLQIEGESCVIGSLSYPSFS